LPLLFGPIHIALLEMIIDPVCALVFEAEREEPDLMKRKPRRPEERLFSLRMLGWSLFQGWIAFVLLAAIAVFASYAGMAEADMRGLTFFSLIGAVIVLILVNRAFDTSLLHALTRGNTALRYVLAAIVAIAAVIMAVPVLRGLLRFGPLDGRDLAIVAGSAILLLVVLEGAKRIEMLRRPGIRASVRV
jgi:Ca2+-transporting ATPase